MTEHNDERPTAAMSEADQVRARVEEATAGLEEIAGTATQREWLTLTMKLNRTRDEIFRDGGLKLLALAWVKEKHEHGGADIDRLLDMTDAELLALHGYPSQEEITAAGIDLRVDA